MQDILTDLQTNWQFLIALGGCIIFFGWALFERSSKKDARETGKWTNESFERQLAIAREDILRVEKRWEQTNDAWVCDKEELSKLKVWAKEAVEGLGATIKELNNSNELLKEAGQKEYTHRLLVENILIHFVPAYPLLKSRGTVQVYLDNLRQREKKAKKAKSTKTPGVAKAVKDAKDEMTRNWNKDNAILHA